MPKITAAILAKKGLKALTASYKKHKAAIAAKKGGSSKGLLGEVGTAGRAAYSTGADVIGHGGMAVATGVGAKKANDTRKSNKRNKKTKALNEKAELAEARRRAREARRG